MLVNYFGPRPVSTIGQSDVMSNGLAGMAAAERQVEQASSEIAREPVYQQERAAFLAEAATTGAATEQTGLQVSDMTRQLINLNEGELVFKANARSIEAAQSMFDSLLAIGRASDTQRSEEDRR